MNDENDYDFFNRKRTALSYLSETSGILESAGYKIQQMQKHKQYGHLTKLRMDLLHQRKKLLEVHDYIKENLE
jgi:citrate synthase|tara:strand:- start:16 stop:234 length:219 start_codon:yes stop_codon:yes gene_type:complete